jgi:xylono-1,5-lactonase
MSTQTVTRCVLPERARLGEGPLWSGREQALYWVDILGQQVHRYAPASNVYRHWRFDDYVGAVAERERGGLIMTLRAGFAFFDPASGVLEHLENPEPGLAQNRFNDGKVDPLGRFWAGTMDYHGEKPTGSLYRFDPDLSCTRIESGYAVSNGPVWSIDGRTMYHNDTALRRVYAYDFDLESGAVANRRLFLEFQTGDGFPDGMTVDAQGGLWIAHYGAGKVTRFLADGTVDRVVRVPTTNVTSCAFGGYELRTLFITTALEGLSVEQRENEPLAGALFACEPAGVSGLPAERFKG